MMQTIWSRAAPTRASCLCPSCLSRGTAPIARRASAATGRRLLKPGYSSTLFYSGIFAAAALGDAKLKLDRRHRWDAAIMREKQGLEEAGRVGQSAREQAEQEHEREQEDEGEEEKEEEEEEEEEQELSADPQDATGLTGHAVADAAPFWPPNTGPDLNVFHVAPESIYAGGLARQKALRNRWSDKKVQTVRLSVQKLVLKCLSHIESVEGKALGPQSLPPTIASLIDGDVKATLLRVQTQLSHIRFARDNSAMEACLPALAWPAYEQDDSGDFHRVAAEMNDALRSIFHRYKRGNRVSSPREVAVDICHNLLTSSAPPNLETYNILIPSLNRLGQDRMVDVVIASLRETHVRPNEVTLAAILRYYIKRDNADMFTYWVRLMRGHFGGLALARPDIKITAASEGRLVRDEMHPERVIQKPYATPTVFSVLVTGVLKFAGFEMALEVCEAMGRDRWGLDLDALNSLMRSCVERRDWESGRIIWNQMKTLRKKRFATDTQRSILLRAAYFRALSLCLACDKQKEFGMLLEEAALAGCNVKKMLKSLETQAGIEGDGTAESNKDTEIAHAQGSQHDNDAHLPAATQKQKDPGHLTQISFPSIAPQSVRDKSGSVELVGEAPDALEAPYIHTSEPFYVSTPFGVDGELEPTVSGGID
ncbi:hypothetical protein B0A49_02370 [Cryomyces minteri]|uniref:Uncharacterized protein n=1 Tax=Cryomyces minteri TaxID=331657 RepID=A0A4U0XQN9_9PEZI|nr:hypothetical protein B0A49_02370 [Cryomyces minteri]